MCENRVKQCCECVICTWSPPASIHSSKEKLKVIRRLNNAIFQAPDHCLRPDFWLLSHFVLYNFSLGSFVLQRLDDKDVEEERKCPLFPGQNTIVSAEWTWERLWQEPVSIHEGNNKGMNRERRDQSQSQVSPRQRQEGIKTWDAAGRVLSLTSFQDTPGFHSDVRKSQTVTWTLVTATLAHLVITVTTDYKSSCFKCLLETAALTLVWQRQKQNHIYRTDKP